MVVGGFLAFMAVTAAIVTSDASGAALAVGLCWTVSCAGLAAWAFLAYAVILDERGVTIRRPSGWRTVPRPDINEASVVIGSVGLYRRQYPLLTLTTGETLAVKVLNDAPEDVVCDVRSAVDAVRRELARR
jgi:hypothetical protein